MEGDRCQSLHSDGARQETLFVVAQEGRAPVGEPAINQVRGVRAVADPDAEAGAHVVARLAALPSCVDLEPNRRHEPGERVDDLLPQALFLEAAGEWRHCDAKGWCLEIRRELEVEREVRTQRVRVEGMAAFIAAGAAKRRQRKVLAVGRLELLAPERPVDREKMNGSRRRALLPSS